MRPPATPPVLALATLCALLGGCAAVAARPPSRAELIVGTWHGDTSDGTLRSSDEKTFFADGTARGWVRMWPRAPDGTEGPLDEVSFTSRWRLEGEYIIAFDVRTDPPGRLDPAEEIRDRIVELTPTTFRFVCEDGETGEWRRGPHPAGPPPAARPARNVSPSPASEASALVISPPPPEVVTAAAELRRQREALQRWATDRALNTLAANATAIDPKFVGVKSTLERLGRLDRSGPFDVAALTFRDANYWRGVMEMAPGNQLVACAPVVLFAANGDLDQAARLAGILAPFSLRGSLADELLREFIARDETYRKALVSEIRRGTALHDQGRYAEAIAVYREILAACPDSAWARYELFYSTFAAGGAHLPDPAVRGNSLWSAAAPEIYRMDPLYSTQFIGERGRSMGALLDRLALQALRSKPPAEAWSYCDTYADLALKLEAYGYAAHIYWSAMGLKSEKVPFEEKLARYLYCLEKLGVTGIKSNFKGDFAAAFAKLDRELAAHRAQ